MADWRDGAQYAPVERPDGFATPRTADLDIAPPRNHPAEGQPEQAPTDFEPHPTPVPPLAALVPATKPGRNPHQAFESSSLHTSTTPTDPAAGSAGTSAWGAAHSDGSHASTRDPRQPMVTQSSFGAMPGSSQPGRGQPGAGSAVSQFAPPTGAPVGGPMTAPTGQPMTGLPGGFGAPPPSAAQLASSLPPPAGAPAPLEWNRAPAPATAPTAGAILQGGGIALWLIWVAAVVIQPLSLLLLLISIPLAGRAKVGASALVKLGAITAVLALVCGLVAPGSRDPIQAINFWAQLVSFINLIIGVVVVMHALGKARR